MAIAEPVLRYSDDQPRDDGGRWTGGDGPSGPGLCYVNTMRHMLDNYRKGDVLVHGFPRLAAPSMTNEGGVVQAGTRFGHAWIERGKMVIDPQHDVDRPVVMPKEHYYALGHIDPAQNRTYTRDEAIKEAIRTEVYGPWDGSVKKAEDPAPEPDEHARGMHALGYRAADGGLRRPDHATFGPRSPSVVAALAGLPPRIVGHFEDSHLSRPGAWPSEREAAPTALLALRHDLLHAFSHEAEVFRGDAALGFPMLERAAIADREALRSDPPLLEILSGIGSGDWAHGWTAIADYAARGGPLTPHLASYFGPLGDDHVAKFDEDQPRDEQGQWTDAGGGSSPREVSARLVGKLGTVTPKQFIRQNGRQMGYPPGASGFVTSDGKLVSGHKADLATHAAILQAAGMREITPTNIFDHLLPMNLHRVFHYSLGRPQVGAHLNGPVSRDAAMTLDLFAMSAMAAKPDAQFRWSHVTGPNTSKDGEGLESFRDHLEEASSVEKYDESQPRDETGKWTDEGGGGGQGYVHGHDVAGAKRMPLDTGPGIQHLHDRTTGRAARLNGEVMPDAQQHAHGEPRAGRLPLPRSLGIPRKDMPQIAEKDHAEFFDFARGKGVGVHQGREELRSLRPAQDEYNPQNVARMPPEALRKPVIVSRDNYVLDGTHRWLRLLGDQGPTGSAPVVRLGVNAHEALALMHSFPKVGRKDVSQIGPTVVAASEDGGWVAFSKYDDAQPRDEYGRWTSGSFSDKAEASKHIISTYRASAERYAPDVRDALGDYSAVGSHTMNTALRRGDATNDRRVGLLDRAIAATKTEREYVAFRGVDRLFAERLQPGAVVRDRAFVSATLSEDVAERFAHDSERGTGARAGTVFRFTVPRGTDAAFPEALGGKRIEAEIVLPRGSGFKVDSVRHDGDLRLVSATYLPPQTAKPEIAVARSEARGSSDRFVWGEGDVEIRFEKYDEEQPRVPAGEPDGGQWTGDGVGAAGSSPMPRSAFTSRAAPGVTTPDTLQQGAIARAFVERGLYGAGVKIGKPNMSAEESAADWRAFQQNSIYSEKNREAAKSASVEAVGEIMANDPEVADAARTLYGSKYSPGMEHSLSRSFATEVVHDWADTAADGNQDAVALQLSAAKVFGLSKGSVDGVRARYLGQAIDRNAWPDGDVGLRRELDRSLAERGRMNEVMLRATYANTQRELAARDIKEITLYRGMTILPSSSPDWVTKGGVGTATQQPLSSWTANYHDAHSFAKLVTELPVPGAEPTQGVVMSATFPAARVVSTPRSGFGVLNEYEFVVAGGPIEARAEVVPWGSTGLPKGKTVEVGGKGSTAAQLNKPHHDYSYDEYHHKADNDRGAVIEVGKYSDEQPRDEAGRWTDAGGSDPRGQVDWARWTKSTSADEKAAMGRYQAGASGAINLSLRGGRVRPEEKDPLHGMRIPTATARIDAAIAKADPLPREAVTYRAIATYDDDPSGHLLDLKPGMRFRDGGYVSTSASEKWVRERYAPPAEGGDTTGSGPKNWQMMEIHVPKGTRVAFLAHDGATDVGGAFRYEQEVLLPRGGTFSVRSVSGAHSILDYEPPAATP